ncbi:hypothetical protein DS380_27620 [Salmonella enterica subsp. enterica serovar Bareilly]|nr:hypothetical protein [Salmonella enterica subsp. enterica serovar Bareilly]
MTNNIDISIDIMALFIIFCFSISLLKQMTFTRLSNTAIKYWPASGIAPPLEKKTLIRMI